MLHNESKLIIIEKPERQIRFRVKEKAYMLSPSVDNTAIIESKSGLPAAGEMVFLHFGNVEAVILW